MCHGGVTVAPRTLWAPGVKAKLSPSKQVTVGGRTETHTEDMKLASLGTQDGGTPHVTCRTLKPKALEGAGTTEPWEQPPSLGRAQVSSSPVSAQTLLFLT